METNESFTETDWEDLLLAWLHDPFDKALRVQGHESRASRYATAALGREVSRKGLHRLAARADVAAAIAERLPSPTAGTDGVRAVGPTDGLRLTHPTSGASVELKPRSFAPAPDRATELIEETVHGLVGPRERFLAIWRLLPDRIATEFGEDAARLPADTRIPDHTLFQHVDMTAGLYAAGAPAGAAYLCFALGPVQPFIRMARSVRDLWTGSALLSWLAFQAMSPVIEKLGPTAFVYPALRGSPLVDLWLRRTGLGDRVPIPSRPARLAPSLPHRFVAVVPWGPDGSEGAAFRRACLDAAQAGWRRVAAAVREKIGPKFERLDRNWARRWDEQIESALDFRAVVAPASTLGEKQLARLVGATDFAAEWTESQRIRELALAIPSAHRPDYRQDSAGRWQAQMEIVARLMAAARRVRHVPRTAEPGDGPSPAKCTLFGSWEQMGPAESSTSRAFWRKVAEGVSVAGVRLRPRERLCAVALTKRFAGPALFASELELTPEDLRFPDTATVAAAAWLANAEIDPDEERRQGGHWSGLWLHWRRRHEVSDEEPVPEELWERIRGARGDVGEPHRSTGRRAGTRWPPSYYAVIAMDGDEIGRWLAGRKTPALRRLLHPKLRTYFEGLGDGRADEGLSARRPVGPALHGAISAALSTFATEVAPEVVAAHHGTMIYSGGDDVVALCPVSTSLDCVRSLRDAFSGVDDPVEDGWRECNGRRRITMGACASMSAGLAVVHFREDLRTALEAARDAEARAKHAGRDLLALVTARRSGEAARATCPWPFVPWLADLRRTFADGASDRWTYKLRAELPTLGSDLLPREAMQAEIGRLVDRTEDSRRTGAEITDAFRIYASHRDSAGAGRLLLDFVTLCQSASFMARGRDD